MGRWARPVEVVVTDRRLPDRGHWSGRRVFMTGHTGFKGGWLALMLEALGARVTGFSLEPPTTPSLFEEARVGESLERDLRGDVRDLDAVVSAMTATQPDVVLHLAAQPLVLEGMRDPVGTFSTNVMGTVHVLEACRRVHGVKACVVVTTDKVYRDVVEPRAHREGDELGGGDPYAASKACAEMAVAGFEALTSEGGFSVATVRAGNVIGGGDWSPWRLLPDLLSSIDAGRPVVLRRPDAVRPWQHVLDPLTGYLLVAESIERGVKQYEGAWNFGPPESDARSVMDVVHAVESSAGRQIAVNVLDHAPSETGYLALSSEKSRELLGWRPRWDFAHSVRQTVEWHAAWREGRDVGDLSRELANEQVHGAVSA